MKRTTKVLLALTMTAGLAGTLLAPATAAAPEELVLSRLDRGAPPTVPHVEGDQLVDGSLRLDLPRRVGRYLGRQGGDYLLWIFARIDGPDKVVRISADGTRELVLTGRSLYDATLSEDGSALASSSTSTSRRTTLRVWDTITGTVTSRQTVRGYGSVLDFDGVRVAVGLHNPSKTLAWTPTTGTIDTVVGRGGSRADLSLDLLATTTLDPYLGGCTVVSSFSDPTAELWRSCRERVEAWSDDGSRMATVDLLADGLGPGRVWLRKTGGRLLGEYDAPYYFGAVEFEDATHLLMNTYSRTKAAIVRCDGDTCERATRTTRHDAPLHAARGVR